VTGDQAASEPEPTHRERSEERVVRIFAAAHGKRSAATFPDCAATPFMLRSRGVFPLSAALTDSSELIHPLPDVFYLNLIEMLAAKVRDDVKTAERLPRFD
jgi:hypothetical protein